MASNLGIILSLKLILCDPLQFASRRRIALSLSTLRLPGDFSSIIETPRVHLSNGVRFFTAKFTRLHLTEEMRELEEWAL